MSNVHSNYVWNQILTELLSARQKIKVSKQYHKQVCQIDNVLKNDTSSLISTIYEFMVESATVDFSFESGNPKFDEILNNWKQVVNRDINIDIPMGLRAVTEQYNRERWRSSFIALNVVWEKIGDYELPSRMWFTDGKAIYVEGESAKLNGYKYYVGKSKEKELTSNKKKTVLIRKPFNSWFDAYPTPYLVKRGALYHALLKSEIIQKQTDLIESIIPHILLIKAGNDVSVKMDGMPSETELVELREQVKSMVDDYMSKSKYGQNFGAFPYDVNLENLIPDLTKFLNETILKPSDKNLLASLGLIELEGFAKSRQETILNPKVLVEEVNESVKDWHDLLQEILFEIVKRNSPKHPKTVQKDVRVVSGLVKTFVTDNTRVLLRSLFDRGTIGHQDLLEATTELDFMTSLKRRIKESSDIDAILFPHVIQNLENNFNDPNMTTPEDIMENNSPEKKKSDGDVKTAEIENIKELPRYKKILLNAIYETVDELPNNIKNVLPVSAQIIWLKAFNSAIKDGNNEETAIKIAWSAVKKKYKKVEDQKKWVKK